MSIMGKTTVRNQNGSDPDPCGNDVPSEGKRHEQIISKRLVRSEVAVMEIKMLHAIISWEERARPDLRKVGQNPTLLDA